MLHFRPASDGNIADDSGAAFTTQTKTKAHFAEDIDIFDFSLTPEEVATLARI